jgi:hypothetical protein
MTPAQEYFETSSTLDARTEDWWETLVRNRDLGYLQALATIEVNKTAVVVVRRPGVGVGARCVACLVIAGAPHVWRCMR